MFQIASPAYTELEVVMMNWLGKLLGLPEEFLNCSEGPGGGVIQVSIVRDNREENLYVIVATAIMLRGLTNYFFL